MAAAGLGPVGPIAQPRRGPGLSKSLSSLTSPPEELLSPGAVHRLGGGQRGADGLQRVHSASGCRRRAPAVEPLQSASGSSTPSGGARQALLRSASSPAEKLARAARTFDRQLTSTFKSQEAKEFNGSATWAVPLDHGLALSTRFQNFKKDKYSQHFENGQGANPDQTGALLEAAAAAQAEIEAIAMVDKQGFADDVKHITGEIEELSRSIRLEHLEKNSPEERHSAAKEEGRRRKEAELRRARKKEQMARDPKRKVALRLENRRRSDDLDAMSASPKKGKPGQRSKEEIPMMKIEAHGHGGGVSEKVTIVDVLKIKQQCCYLDNPCTVADMLNEREREERWEREMSRGVSQSASTSRLFQSSNASHFFANSSISDLTCDERQERAAFMREEVQAKNLIAKMETMRSEWSYSPPCNLTVVTTASGKKTLSVGNTAKRATTKQEAADVAAVFDSVNQKGDEGRRKTGRRRSTAGGVLDSLTAKEDSLEMVKRRTNKGTATNRRRTSQMEEAEIIAFQALRKRVSLKWNLIRAVVKWLILSFNLKKKTRCAELVKGLVKQLGEWYRMRSAVRFFMNSVKMVQKYTRGFLKVKNKRCKVMDKEWEKLEDHHLAVFARHQTQVIVKEQKEMMAEAQGAWQQRKAKSKAAFFQIMQAEGGDISVDTSGQKIPRKERRAVIERYYNYAVRRHVRNSKQLILTVMDTLKARKDLHQFLKSLGAGADDTSTSLLGDVATTQTVDFPYHHLPEDMALNLMARCAQALAHLDQFRDHPANQAIPEHRRTIMKDYVLGSDAQGFARRIIDMMDRPCFKGRLGRNPSERADMILAEDEVMVGTKAQTGKAAGERRKSQLSVQIGEPEPPPPVDVEQVFSSFSPRLKDIVEEQIQEYKESASTEAASEDAFASLAPLAERMEAPDVKPPGE